MRTCDLNHIDSLVSFQYSQSSCPVHEHSSRLNQYLEVGCLQGEESVLYIHLCKPTRGEMVYPLPIKGFLQSTTTATMCCHLEGRGTLWLYWVTLWWHQLTFPCPILSASRAYLNSALQTLWWCNVANMQCYVLKVEYNPIIYEYLLLCQAQTCNSFIHLPINTCNTIIICVLEPEGTSPHGSR